MNHKYYNQLQNLKLCTDGMSPAKVYQCKLDSQTVYLKTIHNKYANTTYSVKREAKIMNWLDRKLNVPKVLEYGEIDEDEYLIMSEIKGRHIDDFMETPVEYVSYLAKAILLLQQIDILNCPFKAKVDFRLNELKFLLDNNLADIEISNWEQTTEFTSPKELYQWLVENKPTEDFVFSHGDIGANLFVKNGEVFFYDLARMGIADKWLDIAFAVRDIRHHCPNYEELFFDMLGIEPDYEKINYFILLDEMF